MGRERGPFRRVAVDDLQEPWSSQEGKDLPFTGPGILLRSKQTRDRLEPLRRHAGRAAIAENRLTELPAGRVATSLQKRWKDGATAVVMPRPRRCGS